MIAPYKACFTCAYWRPENPDGDMMDPGKGLCMGMWVINYGGRPMVCYSPRGARRPKHPLTWGGYLCREYNSNPRPPLQEDTRMWDRKKIEWELSLLLKQYGRMLTRPEFEEEGRLDLLSAMLREGLTIREWAAQMQVEMKQGTSVERAFEKEVWVKTELEKRGHKVFHTSTKCPYDLLVDDAVHVEVKMGKRIANPTHGYDGHFFQFGASPARRDIHYAVLLCVDDQDQIERVYVLPRRYCRQHSLAITGAQRWAKFLNAWRYIKFGIQEEEI